jgi:chemotaxis protein methyltransferase CheR
MTAFDPGELKLLTDLIQERFGITFQGIRQEILARRLQPRLNELHLDSPRAYYEHLKFHPQREVEFGRLAAMVTNNETYFFRETQQFDLVVSHVLPERRSSLQARPLRVLSAGCSSGEEAYSLGITLHNAGLPLSGIGWEIDGCDLNSDRIARAKEAIYDETSLRACDADTRWRYFTEEQQRFRLKDRYRSGIRFFQSNLIEPNGHLGWASYDVVLCRNLLIYFSERAFDSLIALFARCLLPGGYLFLGHSESLIDRTTQFQPVVAGGAVIYRRVSSQ